MALIIDVLLRVSALLVYNGNDLKTFAPRAAVKRERPASTKFDDRVTIYVI
jgi:hypothetical protein